MLQYEFEHLTAVTHLILRRVKLFSTANISDLIGHMCKTTFFVCKKIIDFVLMSGIFQILQLNQAVCFYFS